MRLFCQKRGNFLTSRQKRVVEREAHVTLQEKAALEHTIAKIRQQKPVLQRAMIVTHVMNSLYYVEPLCKTANAGTFPISSFTIMDAIPFCPAQHK